MIGAFDAFPANVALLNAGGDILAVNRPWVDFARANGDQSDAVGQNYLTVCGNTQGEERDTALEIGQAIRDVLDGKLNEFEIEYPCHSPNELRYFLARVSPFTQDNEQFAVVVHHNITRRKLAELEVLALNRTLEERVLERTRELEAALALLKFQNDELTGRNKDLSQLVYVASHDLQEPLRLIGMFTDLLRERTQGQLEPRTQTYMTQVIHQTNRARQLVKDVLNVADVSLRPLNPLDLQDVFHDVAPTLPWPEDARYECQAIAPVCGNQKQLRQLMENLLSNAIKFHSERPLEVTVKAHKEEKTVTVTVQDNGVGIPVAQREFVFGMFRRLHNREVSGNGIGLAMCQKIVERHGGRIWITGDGTQGTCVHFTHPAA